MRLPRCDGPDGAFRLSALSLVIRSAALAQSPDDLVSVVPADTARRLSQLPSQARVAHLAIALTGADILQSLGPGSGSGYSWIGTACPSTRSPPAADLADLLGAASFASLYGRLADIVGRRMTLFAVVTIFLVRR